MAEETKVKETIHLDVEEVPIGQAKEILGVNHVNTLRSWIDAFEELGVHYVARNDRNERVLNKNDLEIFAFVKEQKEKHGRAATAKDLSRLVKELFDVNLSQTNVNMLKDPEDIQEPKAEEGLVPKEYIERIQKFDSMVDKITEAIEVMQKVHTHDERIAVLEKKLADEDLKKLDKLKKYEQMSFFERLKYAFVGHKDA